MQINGYNIENQDKLERAIHGSIGSEGSLAGGVGDGASPEAILAEYDRLGGLIKKGAYKIKTGSFYDFGNKAPRETPEVIYVFRDLNGKEVEVPEGENIPLEVKAAEIASEAKKNPKAKKVARKKVVDESEE